MSRILIVVLAIAILTGCSTVKDVGVGMQVGGAGAANPLGGAVSFVGVALQAGSNVLADKNVDNNISTLEIAFNNWSRHSIFESASFELYRKKIASDPATIEEYEVLTKLLAEVAKETETGLFKFNGKDEYLELVKVFENGNWIRFHYPNESLTAEGITLFCHKNSENCIVALKNDDIVLPIFKNSTILIQKALNGSKVQVGDFTSFEPHLNSLRCRLIPINSISRGGATFSDIFKKEFVEEFNDAGVFDAGSALTLKGHLKEFELSSFGSAYWNITLELSSSNGKSLTASNKFPFESSMSGQTACKNAKEALEPAVNSVIQKVINSPEFAGLFSK